MGKDFEDLEVERDGAQGTTKNKSIEEKMNLWRKNIKD